MPEVSKPFFSIITPVYNRVNDGKLKRCLDSVMTQTFEDFEHIIVDDGSAEDVAGLVAQYDERFRYVHQKHQGRIVARNTGYAAMSASSSYICQLDSDDTYDPEYLRTFHYYIEQSPEVHFWICSSCIHGVAKDDQGKQLVPAWTKIRQAWMPPIDEESGAHSFFMSGKIGLGQYVFSKEAFAAIGPYPEDWRNHNCVADGIHEWTGFLMDPPVYSTYIRLAGNPVGDDFAQILALSKHFRASLIKAALYRQYRR